MAKHAKKNPKNNKIKLMIIIFMIVLIGIFIYFWGNTNKKENSVIEEKKIEETINNVLYCLKTNNVKEIEESLDYKKLMSIIDESVSNNANMNIEKNLFNNINWTIEKIEIKSEETTALIELTNKNYKDIILNWMKKIIESKENDGNVTIEKSLELLEQVLIEDDTIEEKTTIQRINLKKENDKYIIIVDDNLRDLLFPGIDSVLNEIT